MSPDPSEFDRRRFIAAGAPVLAGSWIGAGTACAAAQAAPPSSPRVLRIAHFCDVHLQPEKRAPDGLARALSDAQERFSPDLVLNGGDQVMDVMGADRARSARLFDLWQSVMKQECSVPLVNVIGNHDVFGWNTEKSGASPDDPGYGKRWAMDVFGLVAPYYVLDRGGWRIVVLDSTHPVEGGGSYTARLDEVQFDWLRDTLEQTPADQPILVVSHIPILAACAFFDGENEKSGDWLVPGAWMHLDARRIKDLFRRHPNVKLCVSGHIHLADVVRYLGVTYACNHAVCGSWWDGARDEFPPAYAIIDLHADGSFTNQIVDWGWKPG
ncbi:MAG: metallophosphoesterase [Planctomycetota bacterium]|nr:metallophosphoesterase [Planctomycetota bacterium]